MLWFIKRIMLLCFAVILALSAAVFVGRQKPLPAAFAIYHLSDCKLPCWIGIIPGKTSLGEALARIDSTYCLARYKCSTIYDHYDDTSWIEIVDSKSNDRLAVNFNELTIDQGKDTAVYEINVYAQVVYEIKEYGEHDKQSTQTQLAIGDWYNALGTPDALSVTLQNHTAFVDVIYSVDGVHLELNRPGFSVDNANMLVGVLTIYDPIQINAGVEGSQVLWRGFKTSNKAELRKTVLP